MQKKRICSIIFTAILMLAFFANGINKTFAFSYTKYAALSRLDNSIVLHIGTPFAYVNTIQKPLDSNNPKVLPVVLSNRTLVPVRFIAESLGATVGLNTITGEITLAMQGKTIKLTIGSKRMTVNGIVRTLDVPATVIQNRTLVPVRALSEAFGIHVTYDNGVIILSQQDQIIDLYAERDMILEVKTWFTTSSYLPQNGNPGFLYDTLSTREVAQLGSSVVTIKTYGAGGEPLAQGSAFCVGKGLYLTNYHVIEYASKYRIVTSTGLSFEMSGIAAYDKSKDLALLKAGTEINIIPLTLGSFNSLTQGDEVVAIGSPLGLQNTVSNGIISAFRKDGGIDLIQMTTPITHGSSGGPLIDRYGRVIGVTTSGYETANLNFAVSVDYAADWIKSLSAMSFNSIPITEPDELFALERAQAEQGLYQTINSHFMALENEDMEGFKSSLSGDSSAYAYANYYLEPTFTLYDLVYEIQTIRVIRLLSGTARVEVNYRVQRLAGSSFRDKDMAVQYSLENQGDTWRITSWDENIVAYLN